MKADDMMMWIDIIFCLPFTILVVCCVVKKDQVPIIYYTNLLVANLIQICIRIVWVAKLGDDQTSITYDIIFFFGVLGSMCFKICIALEKSLFITRPLLDCVRQTEGSVVVCVLVWILCISTTPGVIILQPPIRIHIVVLFPAFFFIFSLADTLIALPAATSVPPEEKQRIVGILSLLLLNYFVMILPSTICLIYNLEMPAVVLILLWLSHVLDLILFFFMQKGPIDKLLTRLCCCSFKNTPTADIEADDQHYEMVHVVRHKGQKRQGEDSGQDDETVEI